MTSKATPSGLAPRSGGSSGASSSTRAAAGSGVDGTAPGRPERPDPEVPERARRRTFTAKYKLDILAAYDAAAEGEKGALLRREGLYSSHITEWRRARDAGGLAAFRNTRDMQAIAGQVGATAFDVGPAGVGFPASFTADRYPEDGGGESEPPWHPPQIRVHRVGQRVRRL